MNRHQPLSNTRRVRAARKQQHCSGDTLAKILGVKACYDVIFMHFFEINTKLVVAKPASICLGVLMFACLHVCLNNFTRKNGS